MNEPAYRVVPMPSRYDLEGIDFDCGEEHYNEWLIRYARTAVKSGSASVYLLLEEATGRVVGYFTITATQVRKEDVREEAQGGLMRQAPGYLIGKVALDKSLQGRKEPQVQMGPQLVLDAIAKAVEAARVGGGQVIVIDADNEGLLPFYKGCGFLSTGVEGSLRLYMEMATAREILGSR